MPVKRRKGGQGKQGKQGKQGPYSRTFTTTSGSRAAAAAAAAAAASGGGNNVTSSTENDNSDTVGTTSQRNDNVNKVSFGDTGNGTDSTDKQQSGAANSNTARVQKQQQSSTTTATSSHQHHPTNSNDLILTCTEKRRGVYECDYCHNDISQLPRIRCAVCVDFDLCLDCFATTDHVAATKRVKAATHTAAQLLAISQEQDGGTGTSTPVDAANETTGPAVSQLLLPTALAAHASSLQHHDVTHGYRVCDSTRYPLFPTTKQITDNLAKVQQQDAFDDAVTINEEITNNNKDSSTTLPSFPMTCDNDPKNYWTVEEDLRLLEGIRTHGLGNWVDIADAVGGQGSVGKTPRRCMERYFDDFLGRYGSILPPYTLVPESVPPTSTEKTKDKEKDTNATTAVESVAVPTSTTREDDESKEKDANMNINNNQNSADNMITTATPDVLASPAAAIDPSAAVAAAIAGSTGGSLRSSKRRAAMLSRSNTPSSLSYLNLTSFSQLASSNMSAGDFLATAANARKRYKAIPTEQLLLKQQEEIASRTINNPNAVDSNAQEEKIAVVPTKSTFHTLWPEPFIPTIVDADGKKKEIHIGQEVGREQAMKAEQLYVKTIAACETKEQVEKIRKEWTETRLNQPGGPTALPMRPEDIITMPGSELIGFMPRREDFDVEWDNDAEQAVADMEFLPGESVEDRQLKLRVLEIYNRRMNEREKRKEFVLSRQLYDYRKHQQEYYDKLPRDERDLVLRMRLFERFHTPAEHKQFIADILKAKRLRKEIAKLQMYHRMGIRTLAEAEQFELDKARRQYHKQVSIQKEMATRKFDPHVAAAAAAGYPPSSSSSFMMMSSGGPDSANGDADLYYQQRSDSVSYWKQYRGTSDRKVRKSINRGSGDAATTTTEPQQEAGRAPALTVDPNTSNVVATNTTKNNEKPTASITSNSVRSPISGDENNLVMQVLNAEADEKNNVAGKANDKEEKTSEPAPQRQMEAFVIDDTLPGYHLLSSKEVKLCKIIRIVPSQYLEIKRALIHESFVNGLLSSSGNTNRRGVNNVISNSNQGTVNSNSSTLFQMDVERRGTIIDFIVRAGWIPRKVGDYVKTTASATTTA